MPLFLVNICFEITKGVTQYIVLYYTKLYNTTAAAASLVTIYKLYSNKINNINEYSCYIHIFLQIYILYLRTYFKVKAYIL